MRRTLERVTRRTAIAVVTVAGAVLLLVLPLPDVTASVSVGVLALTLAALASFALRSVTLTAETVGVASSTGDPAPPRRPGDVTDPLHHPLRPRAPGRA